MERAGKSLLLCITGGVAALLLLALLALGALLWSPHLASVVTGSRRRR